LSAVGRVQKLAFRAALGAVKLAQRSGAPSCPRRRPSHDVPRDDRNDDTHHEQTRTIPIVFAGVAEPVASGIVARLDRPSGNITGFALYEPSLGGKWLELLSEMAPGLKRAAIMFHPDTSPASAYMPSFETAARSLKVVPIIAPVHSDAEIGTAIIALGREPGGGLVVMTDTFMVAHRTSIISAAARNNAPAVYPQSAGQRFEFAMITESLTGLRGGGGIVLLSLDVRLHRVKLKRLYPQFG
jgi:hypothetical protein